MPQSQIDFSKYEAQAPPSIDFSKYAQDQPQGKPEGAVSRFLTRATGLPVSDIAAHPGKYLNPLSDEYQQAAKDNANQPVTAPTLRQMTPFGQTAKDIGDKNYAGAFGDLAPGLLAAASMARFRGPMPEVIPPRALPAGPIEAPGTIEASPAPAYSPTTRAQRLNLLLPEQAGGKIPLPASTAEVTAETEAPPTALEQAKARFQAAQQQQLSTQAPESYPSGIQKRPTDRAEILDDKAVREQMQKDLGLQGYRGAREVGEENAPTPKWQQVAQAKAQSVIDSAHEQAAQILADAEKAATTPAKLTKTMAPKSAASAAQPIAEDLNSPDRLIDLMQQSIDRLKAARGK